MDSVASVVERPINWLLLSTARVNRHVVASLKLSQQQQTLSSNGSRAKNVLYGVASRSEESAKKYADENGIPNYFGSYQAGIESADVDVVYISLPNEHHHEWVLKALENKKHVLCEKPLALTQEQVREMFSVAEKNGVLLLEGYMFLFTELNSKIRQEVMSTVVPSSGDDSQQEAQAQERKQQRLKRKLISMEGCFTFEIKDRGGHRVGSASSGGGAIWDIGCYPLCFATALRDTLRRFEQQSNSVNAAADFLLPAKVEILAQQLGGEYSGGHPAGSGPVMAADFRLTYKDGFVCNCHTSFLEPVKQTVTLVFEEEVEQEEGSADKKVIEKKSLHLPVPFKPEPGKPTPLQWSDGKQEEVTENRWGHLYQGEVEALGEAIATLRQATVAGSDRLSCAQELLCTRGALSAEACAANVAILDQLHKPAASSSSGTTAKTTSSL